MTSTDLLFPMDNAFVQAVLSPVALYVTVSESLSLRQMEGEGVDVEQVRFVHFPWLDKLVVGGPSED